MDHEAVGPACLTLANWQVVQTPEYMRAAAIWLSGL
jgi:hypothetical protein